MTFTKKSLLLSVTLVFCPTLAWAQQDSGADQPVGSSEAQVFEDEIIVTARFRKETLQDIGASIGAVSGDDLQRDGLEDFDDISRRIVGIGLIDRGPNQNDVTIRGAAPSIPGSVVDLLPGSSSVVSQFYNDIPISSPDGSQRDFDLTDLSRVEVLRGPQPTLFGEGSVGGTIRYIGNEPTLDAEKGMSGFFSSDLSFTDSGGTNYAFRGVADLTIVPDQFGVRATGFYRDYDGFIDNPATGINNANSVKGFGGSLTAVAYLTERLKAKAFVKFEEDDHGEAWFIDVGSNPEDLTYSRPVAGFNVDDALLVGGNLEYRADNFTLTSITGYYERERSFGSWDPVINLIAGFASIPTLVAPIPVTDTRLDRNGSEEQFTQEVRFVSDFDGPFNVTAGLFYKNSDFVVVGETTPLPGLELITFPSTPVPLEGLTLRETEQISGFAEGTWSVSDRLRLIGGVRYVSEDVVGEVAVNQATFPFPPLINVGLLTYLSTPDLFAGVFESEQTFELRKWLPKVSAEYEFGEDGLLYASWSKGVRNGGVNSTGAVGFNTVVLNALPNDNDVLVPLLTYGEDETEAYEIGVKQSLFEGGMNLNVALFQMDFNDVQTGFAPPGGFNMIVNASDQRARGIEVEGSWNLSDGLSTYFGFTLNDAEFLEDVDVNFDGVITPGVDIQAGNRPIGVAKLQFSLGVDYLKPLGSSGLDFSGGVNVLHQGDRFSSVANDAISEVPSLTLVNLRAGVQNDEWSVNLYIDNAFNQIQLVNSTPVQQYVNQPRVIGINATVSY